MAQTITKIARQVKDENRVSVFLDGDFAFGIHQDLLLQFNLYPGRTLSVEEQEAIQAAEQLFAAKANALAYLTYRPRTEQEVRKKLLKQSFDGAIVDKVIERLYELQYLDDGAYARSYARSRLANRGYGPGRVRLELRRRGVAQPLVEQALEEAYADEDPLVMARAQARKRWPRLARESDPYKRRRKLTDFLVRRGFSYETARQVVEELEDEEAGPPGG
jgi:regulatory protein